MTTEGEQLMDSIRLDVVSAWQVKRYLDAQLWPSLPEDVKAAHAELEAGLHDFVCEDCGALLDGPTEWAYICADCGKQYV
jgi:hypothetical protein